MNRSKISKELLSQVNILDKNQKFEVIITCNDYQKTKKFLKKCNFSLKSHHFARCFTLFADFFDINYLSELDSVDLISCNSIVKIERTETDFMNLDKLTEGKFFGQDQTICFIDTGLAPHFDFIFPSSRIVKFIDLINKEKAPYDDNGHGTFTTGIASGSGIIKKDFLGFASRANIISIKALASSGVSNSNTILDAMQWVYENHKAYNIGIVCMSFGAEGLELNDPLSQGAEALWKQGIIVVAAAGNSGPERNTIKSPGSCPSIITVGALDLSSLSVAEFSSRGPTIYGHKPDLLAPAVDITSCNNVHPPYIKMSGTSVATPIVAGVCAIIKSKWPDLTNDQVKKFLISNCKKITGDVDSEGAGYLQF